MKRLLRLLVEWAGMIPTFLHDAMAVMIDFSPAEMDVMMRFDRVPFPLGRMNHGNSRRERIFEIEILENKKLNLASFLNELSPDPSHDSATFTKSTKVDRAGGLKAFYFLEIDLSDEVIVS